MQQIKPKMKYHNYEGRESFDPMSYDGITLKCCCGYELIKQDDDVYYCTGGYHKYLVSQGDVTLDKFGNIQLKLPFAGKSKRKKKK